MAHNNNRIKNGYPAPVITSVLDNIAGYNVASHTMTIIGENFTENTVVVLKNINVQNVTYIDSNTIQVTVGPTPGFNRDYDITVSNGQTVVMQDGFFVRDVIVVIPGDGTTNRENVAGEATNNANRGLGFIQKPSASSGWNTQGTFVGVPANTDFTLTIYPVTLPATTSYGMFGVNIANTTTSYSDIDFAFYIQNNSNMYAYENGSNKGLISTFSAGDVLKIKRVGTTIEYYQNNNVVRTVTNATTAAMIFDCSLYRAIRLENISLLYAN